MTKHRKPEEMRRRIFDAFSELLQVATYESITTRKIAEQAGVSYTALYTYFGSKEDLLCEFCDEYARFNSVEIVDLLSEMPEDETQGISAEQLVAILAERFLKGPHARADIIADLNLSTLAMRNGEARKRYVALVERWRKNVLRAVEFCGIRTDDAEVTVRYIESLFTGMMYYRAILGEKWGMDALLRGLRSDVASQ